MSEKSSTVTAQDDVLIKKVVRKLIPFLFFLYIIAYLDRVNVNFAKLEMPWFSSSQYAFGAGIFFIAYFIFEVPSNLVMRKVGAKKWIARIMFTWGIIAMLFIYVKDNYPLFVSLRFLLGIAEAGFFPGVLLYLTTWFTSKERAKMVSLFMTANAVTLSLGSPLSGLLIDRGPLFGLAGWQQMFLFEAIPAVLMSGVVLWYLPNGPEDAKWLTKVEKAIIQRRLADDGSKTVEHGPILPMLKEPDMWKLSAVYLFVVTGMYGVGFWVADLVKKLLVTTGGMDAFTNLGIKSGLAVGLVCVPVFTLTGIAMVLNAASSDRHQERRFHVAIPAFLGAAGLVGFALLQQYELAALIALTVAVCGMWSVLGPFWAMPPSVLGRLGAPALAAGLALINSIGNLGGFFGPKVLGEAKDLSTQGLFILAGCVVISGIVALTLKVSPSAKVEASA